jgi:hypothetical protein
MDAGLQETNGSRRSRSALLEKRQKCGTPIRKCARSGGVHIRGEMLATRHRPDNSSHFSSHFFLAGNNTGAEREVSQGRVLCAA